MELDLVFFYLPDFKYEFHMIRLYMTFLTTRFNAFGMPRMRFTTDAGLIKCFCFKA